jgi:hypothetical protein
MAKNFPFALLVAISFMVLVVSGVAMTSSKTQQMVGEAMLLNPVTLF